MNFDGTDGERPHPTHDARLDGHPRHHRQFRVDGHIWLLVEVVADELADVRNPRRPADQNDLLDVGRTQLGRLEDPIDRLNDLLEEVSIKVFKRPP